MVLFFIQTPKDHQDQELLDQAVSYLPPSLIQLYINTAN